MTKSGESDRGMMGANKILALATLLVLTGSFWCCSEVQNESFQGIKEFVFDSSQSRDEKRISLDEISTEFPRDWTSYEALVIELRASSAQRMNLKLYTSSDTGEKYSRVLLHPYPKVWIRSAIPVSLLSEPPRTGHDMAAVGNRSRPGYFLSLWGPFVPLTQVEAIAFEMENPIGSPSIEIRSVELVKESPGDAVVEGKPLTDEFGQYIHKTWDSKVQTIEELQAAWKDEETSLVSGDFGYSKYGGYTAQKVRATGFFRVEKIGDRWWFVDPEGHLFLSAGSDVIQPVMATRSQNRSGFFSELPPDFLPGYERDGEKMISFFSWNLYRRFGENWQEKWREFTIRRMDAWGLNTIANWSDDNLWAMGRKPYVIPLARWQSEVSYLGLPDIYSEEFKQTADQLARRQCEPRKNDPWLLGYFLANEPPFPQKELQTAEMILSGPDTATRQELEKWLAEGDSDERRKEFIDRAFDDYVQITSAAVKKYDPNHLNLGMRGGGRPTEAEIRAARAFDVYSVNIYDYEVPVDRVRRIAELTGKPIIIGEFHFGAPERGLAASLVQVKNQQERANAYRYYVEQAFAMPELIGTHWFQWMDQPSTGRFDGENYNIGLVDVTDRPYPKMIEALKETHRRIYGIHRGEVQPYSQKAVIH